VAEFDNTLYAALAGVAGGRIYRLERPSSPTFPCVVYNVVSNVRAQVLGSTQACAISSPRYQITCWARSQADAVTTAASVRTALLAMTTPAQIVNEYQLREPEAGLYRRDIDVVLPHAGE